MATKSSPSGISFASLLTIVFIALKLMGFIDWNWLWVLSPLWIDIVLFLLALVGFVIYAKIMDRKIENDRGWKSDKWKF